MSTSTWRFILIVLAIIAATFSSDSYKLMVLIFLCQYLEIVIEDVGKLITEGIRNGFQTGRT